MLPELHALKDVQLLDMSISDLNQRLARAPAAIEEVEQEIKRERQRLKAAEEAVEENGRTRRKAEGELQEAESRVEKYRDQLLTAGSNVEYTGLLKQITATREKIGGIEERIILMMDDGDRLGEELDRARTAFAEAEARLNARKETIRTEAGKREQDRDKLVEQRNRTMAGVRSDLVEQYERIRRVRHGLAVARVRESRCVACNVALRPQMYEEVQVGGTIMHCESCGRILYFDPEPRQEPKAPNRGGREASFASSRPISAENAARLAELIVARLDWDKLPATVAATRLRERGVPDRDVRRFLTFMAAMEQPRSAEALWRSGEALFDAHPDVFDPAQASKMPFDSLQELLEVHGVSGRFPNKNSKFWRVIATSLHAQADAVARLVEMGEGDAKEIRRDLCKPQGRYPLLQGPGIGPMWIRFMAFPGGARIKNMKDVPVSANDVVRDVTENLGVTATVKLPRKQDGEVMQHAWFKAVEAANIGGPAGIENTCAALDPALWRFGIEGCGECQKQDRRIPISPVCDSCRRFPPPADAPA